MRASDIIDRVPATLYRRSTPARETVAASMRLSARRPAAYAILHGRRRSAVSIRCELDRNLPPVTADRVQLQQVLINLMLNGIEAMKDHRGELHILSIRTKTVDCFVSMSDTSISIQEGDSEQIFEAFFSTKPEGTGIGLSISRRIIEAHGGRLWVTPNAKSGATHSLRCPARTCRARARCRKYSTPQHSSYPPASDWRTCLKSSKRVRLRQAIEQSARALYIRDQDLGESPYDGHQELLASPGP